MFQLDPTYFIFMVMFLLFIKALNVVYLKPVGSAIAKRRARVTEDIDAGSSCRSEAAQLVSGYEKHLHEIRLQAQALITDVTLKMQKQRLAEVKVVLAEGQTKLEAAKKEIEAERANLLASLVEEEKVIVESIMRKLLGANIKVSLDSAVVHRALEETR